MKQVNVELNSEIVSPSAESTYATYDDHAQLLSTCTSDGQINVLRYYAQTEAGRTSPSDQLPDISGLVTGLQLADGEPLLNAADLQCPNRVDTWKPPLMARLEYLKFEGSLTSAVTLTMCGYAHSTRDAQGGLVPDTVLVLEGVTIEGIDGEAKDWKVSLAASWNAVKVSLFQNRVETVKDALCSATRTVTTWYKDNSARSTQQITEVTLQGSQSGTFKIINTAISPAGGNVILSQQIVSAFSGRILRESQQDGDGKPVRFICHEYDTRGRGTRSTCYAYGDGVAFETGVVTGLEPLEDQSIAWLDSGSGTWVSSTCPDGRQQRTLYDGMQRAVRRELQREAGDSEFIVLEVLAWPSGQAPVQVKSHDYLPGGLCVNGEKEASLPSQSRHYFWQAHAEPVIARNNDNEQTLTTESVFGMLGNGIQQVQRNRQVNHLEGGVTLSSAIWSGRDSSDECKALRTEEMIDARGRPVQIKQHVPLEDSTIKSRAWTTRWDDLDRPTVTIQPDQSEVTWCYQGLSHTPVRVSVKTKDGTEKLLGSQTLQGETVTGRVAGGANGLAYREDAGVLTAPDGKLLYSSETDNATSWYAMDSAGSKSRLLASFEYNAMTRTLKAERAAEGSQQSRVTSEVLTPLLLGGWRFDRTVHAQQQRKEALVSLRGEVQRLRHANGVCTQGWSSPHGQANRVRRGSLEYWYEYTARGQCERTTVRDLRSGRCMMIAYSYDALGNETERSYQLDDQIKARYVQTWSLIGQLLSKTLYRDGSTTAVRTETFTYYTSVSGDRDELQKWTVDVVAGNEVKDADGHSLQQQTYKYDELGSLVECRTLRSDGDTQLVTYTYADTDHPTRRTEQATQLIPAKGSPGVRKTQKLSYDGNGQLVLNEQSQTLAYSDTGRLRSVTAAGRGTPLTYYEYDEHDRLISQWEGAGQMRRVLSYSGEELCAETWLDKDGNVTRTLTLDEHAAAVVQDIQGTVETQLFVLEDPQHAGGDEYWVDAGGTWQYRSLAFTPWGEAPLATLKQMQSGLGHNGQRADLVTGCFHLGNGYRIYDPRHRAFYQRDSWSPFGEGGLNDRAYCAGGDPVNWHDPSGRIMLSRRDQGASLARLDRAIDATKPPVREAAPWWQWVMLAVFVVAAVAATIATFGTAGPVMAGIGMALCSAIMVGGAVTAAGMAMRQSDPRLSTRLEGAGHIVMGLASLPGMVAGLSQTLVGIITATTLVSVSLESARLAVMQENPELARKLGWASMISALSALPAAGAAIFSSSKKVGHLVLRTIRGLRNRLTVSVRDSIYEAVNLLGGEGDRNQNLIDAAPTDPLRSLRNSSRTASPARTPQPPRGPTGAGVSQEDFGDFVIIRSGANRSETLYYSAHGQNKLVGGSATVPENSTLHYYAPATGTISGPTQMHRSSSGMLVKEWRPAHLIASGKAKALRIKDMPGGKLTANYRLSHFEHNSLEHLELIAESYSIDVLMVKPGREMALNDIWKTFETSSVAYPHHEAGFCRSSMLKQILGIPRPRNIIR